MAIPSDISGYLEQLANYEHALDGLSADDFRLDGLRELLHAFGDPQRQLKCIHLAGTKGKGSTCAFAAEILRCAGYRVGLFTSPHLHGVRERIRVLTSASSSSSPVDLFPDEIPEAAFVDIVRRIKAVLERRAHIDVTYFELLTAVALIYFLEQMTDVVVLETGLGGRLDATNVVEPLICAITPISWEHQNILGHTLGAIAKEKAGIIKSCCRYAVVAEQKREAASVIEEMAWAQGVQIVSVPRDVTVDAVHLDLDGMTVEMRYAGHAYRYRLSLLGRVQADNAAMALCVTGRLNEFGFSVTPSHAAAGLAGAFWPGRFEILSRDPMVVVDGAHTVDSIKGFLSTLNAVFPDRKAHILLGLSKDKDVSGIARQIDQAAGRITLVSADHRRALRWDEIDCSGLFTDCHAVEHAGNFQEALHRAVREAGVDQVVAVTGSLFAVAQAREALCRR